MVASIENAGTVAVKKMRLEKLRKGIPFMINSRALPSQQCYLEYPDGSIKLVQLSTDKKEFTIIRQLSPSESSTIRHKYHLA